MPPYRLRSGLLNFLRITGLRRYASPPLARYDYTARLKIPRAFCPANSHLSRLINLSLPEQ